MGWTWSSFFFLPIIIIKEILQQPTDEVLWNTPRTQLDPTGVQAQLGRAALLSYIIPPHLPPSLQPEVVEMNFFCIPLLMEVIHPFLERQIAFVTIFNSLATLAATSRLEGWRNVCNAVVSKRWYGCQY